MLPLETRTVAIELLRPPADYRLDCAVLTTFSLDLETLLALPLAVLSQADASIEDLLRDPLWLADALREAGSRIHVFVDAAAITIPRNARTLYAFLEQSVRPVRARNGGAFHPKVWVARFQGSEDVLLRVAVLSRNLTFDRSWDVALATEGTPAAKQKAAPSRGLADFLQHLPELAREPISQELHDIIGGLAEQIGRTRFPGPSELGETVAFEPLGIESKPKIWRPRTQGTRLLAIAPFVNKTALDVLAKLTTNRRLVSRQETLDALSEETLAGWTTSVLSDVAVDEVQEDDRSPPTGLHAKIIAIEDGAEAHWWVGSANLTAAAFTGKNVELMASLTGARRVSGIDSFLKGFEKLCAPYRRGQPSDDLVKAEEARKRLEQLREDLVNADLRIRCRPRGEDWEWSLHGSVERPTSIEVCHWPLSVDESQARNLELPASWTLPLARLTVFVAFRLSTPGTNDLRMVLKVPAEGLPNGRAAHILRGLIDTPERFLQFLRALLGGLENLSTLELEQSTSGGEPSPGSWRAGLSSDTLLEDLVRVASRDPGRLSAIRRLVDDLCSTEEGRRLVPTDFHAIWTVVDQALGKTDERST